MDLLSPRKIIRRRTALLAPLVPACAWGLTSTPVDTGRTDWISFRTRFINDDGRVVDTGNGGISHSEGQGLGMLFAEHFDDRPTFDLIHRWTRASLRRSNDALHVWRYRAGAAGSTADPNNATDGDLLIALALARAARRWNELDKARSAMAIATDISRLLIVRAGGMLLLLPGLFGFQTDAAITINPSYYIFTAFDALSHLMPSADWITLRHSGQSIINDARFGRWLLPSDWLQISRSSSDIMPAPGWPPRCSYDAIRVPLYLIWAGLSSPAIASFAAFYAPRNGAPPPAWVNLQTGEEAPYAAPAGMMAVARIAAAAAAGVSGPVALPSVADAPDYYSAALVLLSKIAWRERNVP
ncbi:MAG: glycosyl hydrolase family 8 [Acetobacteraceae bacterium]